MELTRNNFYPELANAPEETICRLAEIVLAEYPGGQVKVFSGPQAGLVMLRANESVAGSLFNAGEILVTEVRLELDGQFGYGVTLGNSPRRAMAAAIVDAALRIEGPLARRLTGELEQIRLELQADRRRLQNLVATSKVEFETF